MALVVGRVEVDTVPATTVNQLLSKNPEASNA